MTEQPPFSIADWQAAAAKKRRQLKAAIPESHVLPASLSSKGLLPSDAAIIASGILSPLDTEITSITDAATLLSHIHSCRYTAVEVITAYSKRASIAQQTINCLTEIFYGRALERAQWLDDYLAREGRPVGILHGLPVSLKDCYGVRGIHSTAGLCSWIPFVSDADSSVAKALLEAGAVLYVKTNVSQAMLMVESINNVFGVVRNPSNLALSAGGSSGGEAALVAARGSILGTGTDGGGSIRLPASFCGVWGLKTSKGRIPAIGMHGAWDGNEDVNAGSGPFAHSVSGIELWMRAQLGCKPWESDHTALPMPWNEKEAERPARGSRLKVGVVWDDGVVRPCPTAYRALRMMAELLEKGQHVVLDLPAEHMKALHRRMYACTIKSNVQSGGEGLKPHLKASGEPVVPRTATGHDMSALTRQEIWANHIERAALSAEYNKLWQLEGGLDVLLTPPVAHPAPPHGKYVNNSLATVYNMLDYVTGSVPVTKTDLVLDVATKEWIQSESYPRVEAERFPYDWGDTEMKELWTTGTPEAYRDGPMGVQFVCRRLREEKLVAILKEVEALMESSWCMK